MAKTQPATEQQQTPGPRGDVESGPLLATYTASSNADTGSAEAEAGQTDTSRGRVETALGQTDTTTTSIARPAPTAASFLSAALGLVPAQPQTQPLKSVLVTMPGPSSIGMETRHPPGPSPLLPLEGSSTASAAALRHSQELPGHETAALLEGRCSSSALAAGATPGAGPGPDGAGIARVARSSSSSSDSPHICRFCHDEDSDVAGDRLISPCLCMGSVKYVHVSCLGKWRDYSPSQARKCGSCQLDYRIRQVDSPLKRVLRSWAVPVALLALSVGLAALMGFAPVAHDNDHFGWHMLNGEILMGALGLGVAGYELLSWRSASDVLVGIRGRGWQFMRLAVWYLWRLYVLLCAGLILFLGAYPWFFKAVVALIGIGWFMVRASHVIWAAASRSTSQVMELSDEERAELLQQRRDEEARNQAEQQRLREEGQAEGRGEGAEEGERPGEEGGVGAQPSGGGEEVAGLRGAGGQSSHEMEQRPEAGEGSFGAGGQDNLVQGDVGIAVGPSQQQQQQLRQGEPAAMHMPGFGAVSSEVRQMDLGGLGQRAVQGSGGAGDGGAGRPQDHDLDGGRHAGDQEDLPLLGAGPEGSAAVQATRRKTQGSS